MTTTCQTQTKIRKTAEKDKKSHCIIAGDFNRSIDEFPILDEAVNPYCFDPDKKMQSQYYGYKNIDLFVEFVVLI